MNQSIDLGVRMIHTHDPFKPHLAIHKMGLMVLSLRPVGWLPCTTFRAQEGSLEIQQWKEGAVFLLTVTWETDFEGKKMNSRE